MHRLLLIKAFKKAEEEIGSDKITRRAQHLSDFIVENSKQPYGERILRDYYKKINDSPTEDIHLKIFVVKALSHYLGYEDYHDFFEKNKSTKTKTGSHFINQLKKHKAILIILLIAMIGFFVFNAATKQKWMVWNGHQYEEVDFNIEKHDLGQLKIYKPERIKNFKQISPNCSTVFFKTDGRPNIWYGKNAGKELEYFTSVGLHPKTGKTLKPITAYMIQKYVCDNYK